MRKKLLFGVTLCAAAAAALVCGLVFPAPAGGEDDEGPVALIESPRGGWSAERIPAIQGIARGKGVTRAVLVINGSEKEIPVSDGRFGVVEVVSPGRNTIRLVVEDSDGRTAFDSVTFYSEVPQRDMKITVNWDTAGTDMDLHIVDPNGEECMYDHKETRAGGKLDTDVTDGFGPETFTLANAIPGKYKVFVHYYGPSGGPATVASVNMALHEGTPRERRETRKLVLMAQGEKPLAWEFEVR